MLLLKTQLLTVLALIKGRKEDRWTQGGGELCAHGQTVRRSREEVRRTRSDRPRGRDKRRNWVLFWTKIRPDFTSKWTSSDQQHVLQVAVAAAKAKHSVMCRLKGPVVHKSDFQSHLHVCQNWRPVSSPRMTANSILPTQRSTLIPEVAV